MTTRTIKTKANFTFDHAKKIIFIPKRFANAANVISSVAYNQLVKLTKDFPTYTISVIEPKKKQGKVSYKGLTIDEMKRFISTRSQEESALFEKVVEIAKHRKGTYAITKKWFLNKYKEAYDKELEALKLEMEIDELESELEDIELNEVA